MLLISKTTLQGNCINYIAVVHIVSGNNVQYLGKIEQAHYKSVFLVGSKARDKVGTFANHNRTQSTIEVKIWVFTTKTPITGYNYN